MKIDILLIPFDSDFQSVRRAAIFAEEVGFDGIWIWDHVNALPFGNRSVLEVWTLLSAVAEATSRVTLGPLVLNMSRREPELVALSAATLQQIAGGRLMLGVGTGAGPTSPVSAEMLSIGHSVRPDSFRRNNLIEAICRVRSVWKGEKAGFLIPDPIPPIIVGVHGPKLAVLAGQYADGMDFRVGTPLAKELINIAKESTTASRKFTIAAHAAFDQKWLEPNSVPRLELVDMGVNRLILQVAAPYDALLNARIKSLH